MAGSARSISGGISAGNARCSPSQSPIDHWSPSHLFHAAKIGPTAWWIPWPTAGMVCDENSGGSSHTAARTWPGSANADSHAATTPPDDRPPTIVGRPITRSMNRTRSLPKLSTV